MNKQVDRALHIFLNGLRTLLSPLISIVFSYLIIHYYSKSLWGEFVPFLLYFYLATLISNWGNKDYLLRQFSLHPDQQKVIWQEFFQSRLPILLAVLIPPFFAYNWQDGLYLAAWIGATYISQSIVPIMLYRRDYSWVILIELVSFALLILMLFTTDSQPAYSDLLSFYCIYLVTKSLLYTILYHTYFRFQFIKVNFRILLITAPFMFLGLVGFLQSKVDLYIFQFFASKPLLGEYQIISGFYIFSQSIASIILLPYLKNVYRMQASSLKKLLRYSIIGGFFLNLLANTLIVLVLNYQFDIQLTLLQILCGFIIGYPAYIYAMNVFALFKSKNEKKVLELSIYSFLLNGVVSIVLLSLEQSITSVLIANAMGQIAALLLYTRHKIDDQVRKTPN